MLCMLSYAVRKTVDYYVSKGSTVNICALDISKAFDKINTHCLLLKLMQRRLPIQFITLFKRWFCNVFIKVRWGNHLSTFFRLVSGVRQGGILSPVFFCIYIDCVIDRIADLDIGCYVHGFFSGIWLYADDIILLSASLDGLQRLVNACVTELEHLDLIVNSGKSKCIRIGRRYKARDTHIVINDKPVYWSDQICYLGMIVTSSSIFKCNLHENKANFFKASNCLLSRVGTSNIAVLMSLVIAKCMPMLTYGINAMMLKKYECDKIDNCLDLFLAKLFRTFNKNILRQCLYYTGYLPVSLSVALVKMKFLKSFAQLDKYNCTLFYFSKSIGQDELLSLFAKYNINDIDSPRIRKLKMWNFFENMM